MGVFRLVCGTTRSSLQIGSLDLVSTSFSTNCNISRRFRYLDQFLQMGFFSSSANSPKIQVFVKDGNKNKCCDGEGAAKDAERVCSMLVSQPPNYSIESAINSSGIRYVSQELAVEVLKKLSNAGVQALHFFRWASRQEGFERSTEMYHHLIEALSKNRQFDLIWELVNSMSAGGLLTKETFSLISRRYVRAKKMKEAIETLNKMGCYYGFSVDLLDFNHLVDCICKSKNVALAQKLVNDSRKRKRFSPDLKTYTILLEGWGKVMDMTQLTCVYQEMLEDGLEPDQVTYGILIHAFCKCRKLDHALKIFEEMQLRDIKPNPHIYCNLINGLGAEKRLDYALEIFRRFKSSGFPPDVPTHNATVGAYCWSKQYDRAYMLLDEMKRCGIGPNSRTYNVILGHLIRDKRKKEAYQLFQRMEGEEDGCKPELNTYTMIMRMFCADRKVDAAIQVWEKMNERGVLPCIQMFSELINGLCREGRLEEACRFFEEMVNRGLRPPRLLYSGLIRALESGGKFDWAFEMGKKLDRMRTTPLVG